jgi:hypothetical protein
MDTFIRNTLVVLFAALVGVGICIAIQAVSERSEDIFGGKSLMQRGVEALERLAIEEAAQTRLQERQSR